MSDFNISVDSGETGGTGDEIEETTDATTSFETKRVGAHTYSEGDRSVAEEDGSDDVNPRRLMGDPTINELRWLYRTSIGGTLVDKPIDDAFKNGFDIQHDGDRDIEKLLDGIDFVPNYKSVKKKARRDGFALNYFVLDDSTSSVAEDPMGDGVTVNSVKKIEQITLDQLARYKTSHGVIHSGADDDPINLDYEDYEIRPTGIVMDTNPTSETYKEPLGYLIGPPNWVDRTPNREKVKFYHRNRFIHHVENPNVDADLEDPTLGQYEGDSDLVSVYHLLRGMKKGNWSIMQTIFRYAAKLYHVELPEDADEEDFENADNQMQNLNSKSELVTPAGYEIEDFQTDGQLQPEEYFDVIFKQICASTEMTNSVLFGTQTGTTTGSETDIKNYFNKVERMRRTTMEDDMRRYVNRLVSLVDGRASASYDLDFEVEWGAMFKLSELDNAERLRTITQSLSAAINDFVMTPEEARQILQEEWAEADIDWTSNFSASEKEWLKTLNVAQQGSAEALQSGGGDDSGNPRVGQNGGGMGEGQTTDPEQPSTASTDDGIELTDEQVDRIADSLAERL